MTYKVITDLEELELLWRAGVLYVDCGGPDEKKQWALDTEKEIPAGERERGQRERDISKREGGDRER